VTEIFSQPDDAGPAKASEAETSLSGRLGAQAAETLDPRDSLSGVYIGRRIREGIAGGYAAHDWDGVGTPEQQMALQGIEESARAAIPDISQGDAKLLLKQEGLTEQDVHLGEQETHKLPVLRMRIDEAHTRRDRAAAIERGPQGFFPGALGLVTSLGVGMIDPVNAAAFSIPVIGEARMGKILASAGDSLLARGAARFGQGAAQGAVGTAVVQPADWWLHTRDGQDYTMAQAMESIIMGAGMGGAFHAVPGGVGDVLARRRGARLAGSPQDLLLRALAGGQTRPAEGPAPENTAQSPLVSGGEEVPGISAPPHEVVPAHPADILADLPPAAREDAVHAAMADIIAGRPTQAAEMLRVAADHDPRIAESMDAGAPRPDAVSPQELTPEAGGRPSPVMAAGQPPSRRGRAAADPATWSLFEYLASVGGLKPDPELRAIFGNDRGPFIPGFGPLLRKGGKTLDDALIAAKEGGYFIDPTDPAHAPVHLVDPAMAGREATFRIRDLLDRIDEETRGRRQYRPDHVETTKYDPAHESHQVLAELEHELEASGAKVNDIDPKLLDRTVEIVKRDGETDVLAAYERAIMEDAERYDATAHQRQSESQTAHIPGWDAADIRSAPGDGQGGAGERGAAGRTEPGARGADGAEPRGAGRGNRSSPAVAAADPRWRELADTTPDYNDPEVLAESEAADHVPEPDSLVPERSLTALEKAAADAEEVWRKLEPTLTEKERALVHDVMNQLKLDAETRAKIITDGAACLVGAVG
jgi:hypothetical protein